MNIANDIVSFTASDILLFSPGLQAAIIAEIGGIGPGGSPVRTPEEELSAWTNLWLTRALNHYAANTLPSLDALQNAFVRASEEDQDAAKVFLDQAKAVLGVTVVDP